MIALQCWADPVPITEHRGVSPSETTSPAPPLAGSRASEKTRVKVWHLDPLNCPRVFLDMWWWKWKNWGETIPAFYWGFKSISEGRQNASGERSHPPLTLHISMCRRWKEATLGRKRSYLSRTEESRCCRVGVKGGRQGGQEPSSGTSEQEQRPRHPPAVEICQHIGHLGDQEARAIGEDSVSTSYTWGPGGAPHPLLLSRCSMPRGGAGVGGNTGGVVL